MGERIMIDIGEFQQRFPSYKIRSQPAPGCTCANGVRTTKDGREHPCLCVCMDAPSPGEEEYRVELGKSIGAAARKLMAP